MVEIKKISEDRIIEVMSIYKFNKLLLVKDYYVTIILFLIKDIEGIYFKGGTALQKIFLDYSRLSEDVDYTVTGDIIKIKKQIKEILVKSGFFDKVTKDKDVSGFVRLIAHYKNFKEKDDFVFIDLNKKAKLFTKPEIHKINHFYDEEIPQFSVSTLSKEEMFAEKMAATIGRNKPRDHFDIYQIIKKGYKINQDIVKEKCRLAGNDPSITKMFNKAKKLYKRWNEDMLPLISEEITFNEVIKPLAEHFNLKEEKEKLKNSK